MRKYRVAIIGATGVVGQKMLEVLEERNFPVGELLLFSSKQSAGTTYVFKDKNYEVQELNLNSFVDAKIDFALFSAGADISLVYAPLAVAAGATVIDNSSAWRMTTDIPLVVPEVNSNVLKKTDYLIANPNCSTIQSVVPLKIIDDLFGIKRIVYSSYQAVSGSGLPGIEDLRRGSLGEDPLFYPREIYDNVMPHIDEFTSSGDTKEEIKMREETRKILGKDIAVSATCVRVPVYVGHSVSANVECYETIDIGKLIKYLENAKGIIYHKDYPTTIDIKNKDEVHVGRLRLDFSVENGINLWIVADNIRKGAATNTIQIAESMIKEGLR